MFSTDSLVQRILPTCNPNPDERARAWNEWLAKGGALPVLKFIRWTNGTPTEDDEILQETLLTAFIKVERGQYEDRSVPFTAFLKKIAWYKIMEASRRESGKVSIDDLDEVLADEPSDAPDLWKEHELLKGALDALPPRRSHVVMMYEHGYSTSEIAEQLGIREELVRKEKSLGLRQLRQTLALAG